MISQDRRVLQRAFYFHRIYADPKEKDTIYAMDVAFLKSTDGGKDWKVITTPHGDHHDLWIDPNNNQRMINSNDGGGTVTVTAGVSWTGEQFPTAQLYHVSVTKDTPYQVCGAQQDNTTVCVQSEAPKRGFGAGGMFAPFVSGGRRRKRVCDTRSGGPKHNLRAEAKAHCLPNMIAPAAPFATFRCIRFSFRGCPPQSLPERWQWTFPDCVFAV